MASLKSLQRRLDRLNTKATTLPVNYDTNPEAYAKARLRIHWWAKQQEIAQALLTHRRVMVKAGHGVGKSNVCGGLVNWYYDSFRPSAVLTTAPTLTQVEDVLWKEIRVQRKHGTDLQPKAARMADAPNHYAVGYTARDANAFQGRHEDRVLIVFDEAVGVASEFWDAAEGMMTGPNTRWLVIFNPTDTTSRAYQEEQSGRWHVITVSCLDHPNIQRELDGGEPLYPAAVRLAYVRDALDKWCTPISADEATPTDVCFDGKWYRPGPLFECKVLGRWPSAASGVWSDTLWAACLVEQDLPKKLLPEIGCDVARKGEDFTAIHVRVGNCSIHHERHNGWRTNQTAGRLKELCREYARQYQVSIDSIKCKIDDDGVGGGVVDQAEEFSFVAVNASCKANDEEHYRNRRNELWFDVADRAREGLLDLSRLDAETLTLLKSQAMAPMWRLDSAGRREIEPKDDTKKKIGCSPDDMDALNLAYSEYYTGWENRLPSAPGSSLMPEVYRHRELGWDVDRRAEW